jgi:hypothetical protein
VLDQELITGENSPGAKTRDDRTLLYFVCVRLKFILILLTEILFIPQALLTVCTYSDIHEILYWSVMFCYMYKN